MRGLAILALFLASCAALPRAPDSTCMQRTMDSLALDDLPDARRHCLASATIAVRCGPTSAWTAGYAKEASDLFGPGDFERRDLRANAAGRACGANRASEADLPACCARSGF